MLASSAPMSLGSRRIIDVRRADVARMHGKLSASPYQANRSLAVVSAIWNWAARRDEVAFSDNPARAIERYPEQGRERYLTSDELARLGDVPREDETVGRRDRTSRLASTIVGTRCVRLGSAPCGSLAS